jgi:hypothetical protein
MGLPGKHFRISRLNVDYELSPTYPRHGRNHAGLEGYYGVLCTISPVTARKPEAFTVPFPSPQCAVLAAPLPQSALVTAQPTLVLLGGSKLSSAHAHEPAATRNATKAAAADWDAPTSPRPTTQFPCVHCGVGSRTILPFRVLHWHPYAPKGACLPFKGPYLSQLTHRQACCCPALLRSGLVWTPTAAIFCAALRWAGHCKQRWRTAAHRATG